MTVHAQPDGRSGGRRTVAIMQPYFFPYAGYYRLLAAADLFVIYDCVQFPRRGRVHRSQIAGGPDNPQWLTLPLARQPRNTLIRDVALQPDAAAELGRRLARLAWVASARGPAAGVVRDHLAHPSSPLVDYLEEGLRLTAGLLSLDTPLVRSSSFAIDPALRGQERIIAIATAAGARRYVNLPGGRALYQAEAFSRAGLELAFLTPYHGRYPHMLPALLGDDPAAIRRDILDTAALAPDPGPSIPPG